MKARGLVVNTFIIYYIKKIIKIYGILKLNFVRKRNLYILGY